jgi:carboxymethylenebutenolidase
MVDLLDRFSGPLFLLRDLLGNTLTSGIVAGSTGGSPMPNITIQANDGSGSFSAYLLEPKDKPAGVVVLIQEIFGVNQAMRDTAAWVADMGFIALCPDLFWRIEPGVDITDKSEAEWKKAFDLFNRFDQAKGIEDLKATVAAARKLPGANGKVATMGYCLGGRLAFMMAEQSDADANISYYGVGLDNLLGDLDKVTKPLLVHIADRDEFFPPDGRAKVVEAVKGHPHIRCHVYHGADHAFARVGGVHWDGRSAAIANGRSAEMLVAAIG